MATNFPGSQDSFTNPTSSDTLDSPDHAAQHANVNDAVEAIELALLDGAPLYIDDTNERVGIGTTSPGVPLHVSSTGAEGLRIQKSNNDQQGSYIGFYDDDARLGYVGYAANDDLYLENEAANGKTFLSCGGSIRLTIDNNTRGGVAYTPSTSYVSGGTWDFEYVLIDKFLTVTGEWTFTSGASVSSFWRIGLPSSLTWDTDCVGNLIMNDYLYGGDHIGFTAGFAGGSDIFAYRGVESSSKLKGSSVTSSSPFTWGTNDSFKITISGTVS